MPAQAARVPVADVETMVLVDTTVRRTGEDAMKVLVTGASGQLGPFVTLRMG